MIRELEMHPPACVVYSLDDWRIDDIPEEIQVPELVSFLRAQYVVVENLGNVLIMRKK